MSPTNASISTLNVPTRTTRPGHSRSASSSSLHIVDEPLTPQIRTSQSTSDLPSAVEGNSATEKDGKPALQLPMPARPAYGRAAPSTDLRSGLASPVIPVGAVEYIILWRTRLKRALKLRLRVPEADRGHRQLISSMHTDQHTIPHVKDVTTLYAGSSHKAFNAHVELLTTKVPFFGKLFAFNAEPTAEQLTFPDLDEYAFALFIRWIYGGKLHGPHDFHSFQHYLCCYVLALRWHIEVLCNNIMDLCRIYYRQNSMTAPAYRLEFIYTYTDVPNHMRNFLVTTAAYRCLCEAPAEPGMYMSHSIKTLLEKGGDFAVDFAQALVKLGRNGIEDVRKGDPCTFHEHADGKRCPRNVIEPYMA